LSGFVKLFLKTILPFLFILTGFFACAQQVTIRGTVFNMYRTRPLEAVSVISTSGRGTTTDSNGNYAIGVDEGDSLTFSYLGRSTMKFPVREMNHTSGFDIALHVNPTELNEVRVAPKNYHMDSLQNRKDYERIFDFRKPGIGLTSPESGGLGVGLDLDELINMFRFNRTRRILAFQRRLIEDEQDKYIDHRFNRSIVRKITHLEGDEIDTFMLRFRPSYNFTKSANDYDFYDYIKLAYLEYKEQKVERGELHRYGH
jgi:CarboxypepD_reg-like domain